MSNNFLSNVSLRRTAKEIRKYRLVKKSLKLIAAALLILTVMTYVITVMYTKFGSFTVTINKFDNVDYSIALSETADLSHKVVRLNCDAVKDVTNIDGNETLPMDRIGSVDGQDNGSNYLCYTFYLVNNGESGVNLDYKMYIANVTQNMDEAIRVRLITSRNSEERKIVTYAKAASVDEFHNAVPEPGTECFEDLLTVHSETISGFMPNEVYKFTVVIWVEGPDPDCVDALIGGSFKMDMSFSVAGIVE